MSPRKIVIVCTCFLLTACGEKPVNEWNTGTKDLSPIKGLEGCFMYSLKKYETGSSTYVVRCKNAETVMSSYSSGKSQNHINLIDDESKSIDDRIERLNAYKKKFLESTPSKENTV